MADMLIDEFTSVSMRKREIRLLRQIAEHLLVYCNNAEVE